MDLRCSLAAQVVCISFFGSFVADEAEHSPHYVSDHRLTRSSSGQPGASILDSTQQLVDIVPFGSRNNLKEDMCGCDGAVVALDLSTFEEANGNIGLNGYIHGRVDRSETDKINASVDCSRLWPFRDLTSLSRLGA